MLVSIKQVIISVSLFSFYFYSAIDKYLDNNGLAFGVSIQFFLLIPVFICGLYALMLPEPLRFLFSKGIFFLIYISWSFIVTIFFHPETARESLAYVAQILVLTGSMYISLLTEPDKTVCYISRSSVIIGAMFVFYFLFQYLTGGLSSAEGKEGEIRVDVGNLGSTEYTIYAGSIYFLIVFATISAQQIFVKIFLSLLAITFLYLIYISGAISPIVSCIVISFIYFLFYLTRTLNIIVMPIIAMMVVAFTYSSSVYDRTINKITGILFEEDQTNIRYHLYNDVIDKISNNQLIGIGINKYRFADAWYVNTDGIVTHNNALGIAVGVGIPAAISYFLFLFIVLISMIRSITKETNENLKSLYISIFCILLYQQSRGLVQDTWSLKEIPFWIGIFFGLKMHHQYQRHLLDY